MSIERTPAIDMPTPWGTFEVQSWRGAAGEHLTLSSPGTEGADARLPLVRIHSECATGDIFGSFRCDCGEQLAHALTRINAEGGTLVYMRGHEGRGIGLFNKILAYAEQDRGADTVDANMNLGLPVDARDYTDAAEILRVLGIDAIRLLSNNPAKDVALSALGVRIDELVPSIIEPREANSRYLATKRDRMAHRLPSAPLHHTSAHAHPEAGEHDRLPGAESAHTHK